MYLDNNKRKEKLKLEIVNKRTYNNTIFYAIVVNNDTQQDPNSENRVQIYIPSLSPELKDTYESYISNNNKSSDSNFNKFPWAKTLVKDLKNGDAIYGNYIDNDYSQPIILGQDGGVSTSDQSADASINGISGDVLSLAMPIILHNEVGISVSNYPDGISASQYENVNPNDNGALSVGLIQWHANRAFDILYKIISEHNISVNTSTSLGSDLSKAKSHNSIRGIFGYNTKKLYNKNEYNLAKSILSQGHDTQLKYASQDTQNSLDRLNKSGLTNIGCIIFLLDIMNQYGSGISSKYINKAVEICKNNTNTYSATVEFANYWNNAHSNAYLNRRKTTLNYIKQLNDQGKLQPSQLTTLGKQTGNFVPRKTAPTRSDYWYNESRGNKAYSMWCNNGNCTYYAWARASEILGRTYDGTTGNGSDYGGPDKYKTGTEPRPGSIITWYKPGGAGHVAIVEEVSSDKQTIWTSESGWHSFMWKYKKRSNDGNWGAGSRYRFRNFKYLI